MNFEDLQKAWQSQDAGAKVTVDADELLKKVRRNRRKFARTIFWRDVREVGVAYVLTWYFIHSGLSRAAWYVKLGMPGAIWSLCLLGVACFGVGTFILVDRRLQRGKHPVASDSLVNCLETSLQQISHQIWLLKNVFWWYLLPLIVPEAIFGAVIAVSTWRLHGQTHWLSVLGTYVLICGSVSWFIYWLNLYAVKKNLEPRRRELEMLLAETGNPVQSPEIKNETMKTTIIVTTLLLVILSIGVGYAAMAATSAASDQSLEGIRKRNDLPALAVVVVKDGKICDRAAVGVRKQGDATPATTNDVFHIGSCTKPMTATLTAMLIEEGKLRWDTTIADVFPELKGKIDQQYEAVTVEQLLHHRGGVPSEPPAAAWKKAWEEKGTPTEQRREFIEAVLAAPPAAAPGAKMIYSNQGYAVIGAMLERITGQQFETLMMEKLFKPLHMDSAGFGPPGTTGTVDEPWGHTLNSGVMQPIQADNPPAIAPAGRVHCSLDDLARFAMLHLQGSTNGLIKPETLARLHALPAGAKMESVWDRYACGWLVLRRGWAGGTALKQDGSNTMWYVVMWLAPGKNFAVIAATNIAGPDAEQAGDDAATAMIYKWLPD
ncbi:MAG TPA: serine hydrolase domain-containing protein [Candidatus Acidoferrales bacterium]|jgi:CubicO group peptidase (beta-lactamase class C family)|nr:serine hydrolase domain-containing protein [Candidatus Acidoferrales bacterium]